MSETHPIYAEIRRQLLQSNSEDQWDSEQWWQAFIYIFYYGPRHEMHLDIDDLLFLVFQVNLRSSRSQKKPYMVLRRDSDVLPAEFVIDGERYSEIDWRRTLELNLVLQSSYSLTVAICNVDEIPFLMQTEFELSESTTVVSKHVHASTVSAGVNITHKKLNEAAICYPDICFAVEDFEEAFSSLIVSEVQQRFCVILTILKNSEPENSKAYVKSEDAGESKIKTGTKRQDKSRVFGGFVSFSQIKTELIGRQNWLKRISQEQTIRMRGPNGNGFAEVSSSIDPQCYQALSSSNEEEAELGFRQGLDFLKRGVASAKDLMRRIQRGDSNNSSLDLNSGKNLKFCCSLMTLTLPVSFVASKILELGS